ncbi:MAG: SpoVR family protein, partial [Planctomycetota bacterium]
MVRIKAKAVDYGLDFYETVFQVLDFDTMNQIAAYGGFPVRYPHW